MRRLTWTGLLVGLAAAVPVLAQVLWPSVSDLAPQERLVITYEATGCFFHERRQIVLSAGDGHTMRAEVSPYSASTATTPGRPGGTIELTSDEISQLERLITLYRRPRGKQGGCTSQLQLDLEWHRGDSAYRKETFVDANCDVAHQESAMVLSAMVARADERQLPNRPLELPHDVRSSAPGR